MTSAVPPLILTLAIETGSFLYFDALRQKYFPPERNFIDAHLTLFHALPQQAIIYRAVKDISNTQTPFILKVKEPVSIGKGVAFKLESREFSQLHQNLQNQWLGLLTPQDKQKRWPHITVQNKVNVQEAQTVLNELKKNFTPFTVRATGLQLWEYLNGPWKLAEEFIFKTAEAQNGAE